MNKRAEQIQQAMQHPALEHDLELQSLLPQPGTRTLHLQREQDRVAAALSGGGFCRSDGSSLALVRELRWDSGHFGVPCADLVRLYQLPQTPAEELQRLLVGTIEQARRRGLRFLSVRLEASQLDALRTFIEQGFRLVDVSVELGTRFLQADSAAESTGVPVRIGTAHDRERVLEIARTFVDNRFFRDPLISDDLAARVYTSWAEAALAGHMGSLLVAEREEQLAGFCTCLQPADELDVRTLGLVIVHPAHRGRGVLAALVSGAAQELGAGAWVTSTQLSNAAALRGFGKSGLLPYSSRYVLHGWL